MWAVLSFYTREIEKVADEFQVFFKQFLFRYYQKVRFIGFLNNSYTNEVPQISLLQKNLTSHFFIVVANHCPKIASY